MNDRDRLHLLRINNELALIKKNTKNINKNEFIQDDFIQHGIMMALINIGECVLRLSNDFKSDYTDIPWDDIKALRNIAAHDYWNLTMRHIWDTLQTDIPILYKFISQFDL